MEFAAPVGLICSDNGEGGKWILMTTSGVEISEKVSNQRQFVLTFFTLFGVPRITEITVFLPKSP